MPKPSSLNRLIQVESLTPERARELIDYDPVTGVFTRKLRGRGSLKPHKVAGSMNQKGYIYVTINSTKFSAHRLAWFMVHGEWPPNEIDHINRVPSDNRIANLRLATRTENGQNRRLHANNTSGARGCIRSGRKWVAQICINGKGYHLGSFNCIKAASSAYETAARMTHGEFLYQATQTDGITALSS